MPVIHVFKTLGDEKNSDKWGTIEFKPPFTQEMILEDCDFYMPYEGVLFFPHPINDDENICLAYKLPSLTIPDWVPNMRFDKVFTPELKARWTAMPGEQTLEINPVFKLCVRKHEINVMESQINETVYIYKPYSIIFDLSNL
jgi:hypothetical protein